MTRIGTELLGQLATQKWREDEEEKSQFGARVTNLGNPLSATLVINFQFLVAKLAAWLRNDPIDI